MLYEILTHYNYYDLYFWHVFNIFSTSNSVATLQFIAMDKEESIDYIHHKKICYAKNGMHGGVLCLISILCFIYNLFQYDFECCCYLGNIICSNYSLTIKKCLVYLRGIMIAKSINSCDMQYKMNLVT